MHKTISALAVLLAAVALAGCQSGAPSEDTATASTQAQPAQAASVAGNWAQKHRGDYAQVKLTADLSSLDGQQKHMLRLLVKAAQSTNALWWRQSVDDQKSALEARIHDPATRRLFRINYGPWDRLHDNHPFVAGVGPRPAGLQFYPHDMSKAEFKAADLPHKTSLYTLLRRDADGKLQTVPYHEAYQKDLQKTAGLLRRAAKLAESQGLQKYLNARADALLDDHYRASQLAWMDMRDNPIGIVIGPIETYEDQLFGYKTSYEAYVLLRDQAWTKKLQHYMSYLPQLQKELPVPAKYKTEKPGSDSQLVASYALYYGGDANVGAKTIAMNLPNDEQVQLQKGTRRIELENAIQAKFDQIMVPIGKVLIAKDQQQYLTADAFFQNTMFHEIAHGLGIKHTIDDKGTVRKALKDQASSFEEGKADVLGLFMIEKLAAKGELDQSKLMDNYVTFVDGMLRSVRFGASDAHAKANMVRFNYFLKQGAIVRDDDGRYRVDADKMRQAIRSLSHKILVIQGDGDYAEARKLTRTMGVIKPQLAQDLARLKTANIPIDVIFQQGLEVLGLEGDNAASH